MRLPIKISVAHGRWMFIFNSAITLPHKGIAAALGLFVYLSPTVRLIAFPMRYTMIVALCALGLVSCEGSGPRYQATRLHIPMHTKAKQGAFGFYGGLGGHANIKTGLDASCAITDHIAVKAGGMMAGEGSSFMYDISGGAFTNDQDTNVSLAGWLIAGRESAMSHDRPAAITTKYGFQAEIGLHGRSVEGIAALRFMWLNFPATYYLGPYSAEYVEPTLGLRIGGST